MQADTYSIQMSQDGVLEPQGELNIANILKIINIVSIDNPGKISTQHIRGNNSQVLEVRVLVQ